MPNRSRLPLYRHHKPSGQAVVTLSGCDIYLGSYGTQLSRISRSNYDRESANGWPRAVVHFNMLRPSIAVVQPHIHLRHIFRSKRWRTAAQERVGSLLPTDDPVNVNLFTASSNTSPLRLPRVLVWRD